MGNLTPGTTYIYERANGVTYSREFGAAPSTRKAIGWDAIPNNFQEDKLWFEIRHAAKTNPSLQDVLTNAIMLYKLTKIND